MENIMELRLSRFSIRKLQYKPVKRRKEDTLYPGLKNSYKYTIHEFLFPFLSHCHTRANTSTILHTITANPTRALGTKTGTNSVFIA